MATGTARTGYNQELTHDYRGYIQLCRRGLYSGGWGSVRLWLVLVCTVVAVSVAVLQLGLETCARSVVVWCGVYYSAAYPRVLMYTDILFYIKSSAVYWLLLLLTLHASRNCTHIWYFRCSLDYCATMYNRSAAAIAAAVAVSATCNSCCKVAELLKQMLMVLQFHPSFSRDNCGAAVAAAYAIDMLLYKVSPLAISVCAFDWRVQRRAHCMRSPCQASARCYCATYVQA
eukprot:4702-Heterococcus_DN1.PRE.3